MGGTILLYLILLTLLTTPLGLSVRVFLLQSDIWAAPRDDVYLRFNMTNQEVATTLTDFTICSRVYLTAITTLQVLLSYATADAFANAIMMYVIDGKHYFRLNNNLQEVIESLRIPTVLNQWRHYCHVLVGDTYTVYVDGVALTSGPIQGADRILLLNGTLIIGQEQDGYSRRFDRFQIMKGSVTQINIWSYGLNESDIRSIALCKSNILGNVISSDRDTFELINIAVYNAQPSEFCKVDENVVTFPELRLFEESIYFCKRIGASMYAPPDQKRNQELSTTLHEEELCVDHWVWIGATDEEEENIWRDFEGKILTEIDFSPGQPDITRLENCLYMGFDSGRWGDMSCQNYRGCVFCDISQSPPLFLRGLCMEWRTQLLFEIKAYKNNKPYFHGYYGLMIYKASEKDWILFDTAQNQTQAILNLASINLYPFGRHIWTLLHPLCDLSVGTEVKLSLSTCDEGQYMCDDGQCIDLQARCDAMDDCDDQTDEDNCSIMKVPSSYRAFQPPKNFEDPTKPLQPYLRFMFIRFIRIEDVQQTIHLEFNVYIEWADARLKYKNLHQDIHANKLSNKEVGKLWRPELEFLNVEEGKLKLIKENVFVSKVNSALPFDFNSVEMDTLYGGVAASLIQVQHFSGSFVCTFDVSYYPFDVQKCSVLVKLSSISQALVELTTERSNTVHGQNLKQASYEIGDFYSVAVQNTGSRHSYLEVGYTLTRKSTRIVLSIYLPSIMLLIIGYSTLYVSVNMLQVRLTVSLTTLLVLYTFFNQASSSLPDTSYIKMIDVWFFSCTILLFLIIMVHVIVECLDRDAGGSQVRDAGGSQVRVGCSQAQVGGSKAPVGGSKAWVGDSKAGVGGSLVRVGSLGGKTRKVMVRVCHPSAEWVLRLVRLVVVPLVVLVFGTAYWVCLLYF